MKAVILAGGDLVPAPYLRELTAGAGLVVAADSGLRHAEPLGLEPQVVVGDFDSVSTEVLARYPQLPRHSHPVDKDLLDLELAIALATARGATELVVVGAFGSRLDQTLAAILIGARLVREGMPVSLHDGERDAYFVSAGRSFSLSLPSGTTFSLLALQEARCTVTGAAYQLDDATLRFGVGLGLANRARDGGPRLAVYEGLVALIVERALERLGPTFDRVVS